MSFTNLTELLTALVSGGLSGTVAYWLLSAWPAYVALTDANLKRVVAIALSGLIAVAAWAAGGALGVWAFPVGDARVWVLVVVNVFIAAGLGLGGITSQIWHGFVELPKRSTAKSTCCK